MRTELKCKICSATVTCPTKSAAKFALLSHYNEEHAEVIAEFIELRNEARQMRLTVAMYKDYNGIPLSVY